MVAVSDSRGAVYASGGVDVAAVSRAKEAEGEVRAAAGSDGLEEIEEAELLALEVDVLAPSALENAVTDANAGDVRARYVFEIANGPVSMQA